MFQSANGATHYLQRFPQAFQGLSGTNNFWQFGKDFQTSEMSFQLGFKDPEIVRKKRVLILLRVEADNAFHLDSFCGNSLFNANYMIDSGNEIKLISSMMITIIIIMMIMIMKFKMCECQSPATSVIPIIWCQWNEINLMMIMVIMIMMMLMMMLMMMIMMMIMMVMKCKMCECQSQASPRVEELVQESGVPGARM